MENRISVSIGGRQYTLVTEENEASIVRLADYVDAKMLDQKRAAKMSDVDAAVMAALVIAEEYFAASERAENARSQIQSCVEDASRARAETAELKREISRYRK